MIDHFGILAPVYDRVIGARSVEQLIAQVDMPADGALLDSGGGTGRIAGFFRGKARRLVVADLSVKMLEQASLKDGLQPVCSVSEGLPFPDEVFDRAIMVDALHHVYSQKQTAEELWRVLKHGGRLVIVEPDLRSFGVKLVALAEKLALMRSHFLSPPDIAALFNHPRANVHIRQEGFNAWVVVEKPADS